MQRMKGRMKGNEGRGKSDALHYSLAEFSWILLFLAIGALVLIAFQLSRERARVDGLEAQVVELQEKNGELIREVNVLNELLAEKKNGVVPCWRRPEGVVPKLMGTIRIQGRDDVLLSRSRDGEDRKLTLGEKERQESLIKALTDLFYRELAYAREKNCYVRLRIVNETNSFKFYQEASDAATEAGIVVVQ